MNNTQLTRVVGGLAATLVFAFAAEPVAHAQFGQGQTPAPPPVSKPDGVAEKAPTSAGIRPTTPILPPPKSKKKKFQLFELDGYFRFRGDWFKNFHLGFNDDPVVGGAPFRRPLACSQTAGVSKPCESTIKSSNIRLRLEPTINIDEKTSVHFQVDVLDNLVLGSTPDGVFGDGTSAPANVPISAFTGGQAAPEAGRNSNQDSLRVKRAWAEVMTPLGLLKFGRMPFHWGMGLMANAGGPNSFDGSYDLDSDWGDNADRIMFATMIPGTEYRLAIAMDWVATAPVASQSDIFRNRYDAQPWDLDDNDDVNQWVIALAKLKSPTEFQDIVDQGDLALNYGGVFVYRTQSWDQFEWNLGETPDPDRFVPRGGKAYIPDVYVRLGYKKLTAEFEGVAVLGNIDELTDQNTSFDEGLNIRQFGAVGKLNYKLLNDALNLGFEVGFASGDQWDNSPQGTTNVRDARALVADENDKTINAFRFDFDYEVDMILFRELLGTVTNATYLKPSVWYDINKRFRFKTQSVVSFANIPVSTPGNGSMYGVEFDFDLGYQNNGFFAGIAYGVLFPLGALDHPGDVAFGYGSGNTGEAGTAQTIQSRFILQF